MVYLITGSAGFIGSNVASQVLERGENVVGLDNLNSYYDPTLKSLRLRNLSDYSNFKFINGDINNQEILDEIAQSHDIYTIYHLAAQAGVRLPSDKYRYYIDSNVSGFTNILNFAVKSHVPNFIYASSSSVYGNTNDSEFSESNPDTNPTSYYGCTKLYNEKIANVLVRNTETRTRGLRFFTVYGELGRPDMAYFRIANAILNDKKFNLYGDGNVKRDFTYIDDAVESTLALGIELEKHEKSHADIVNVGGGRPVSINDLISEIGGQLGKSPEILKSDSDKNDVEITRADTSKLKKLVGFVPQIELHDGIQKFLHWAQSEQIRCKLDNWVNSTP